jgi:hypothetical protein
LTSPLMGDPYRPNCEMKLKDGIYLYNFGCPNSASLVCLTAAGPCQHNNLDKNRGHAVTLAIMGYETRTPIRE